MVVQSIDAYIYFVFFVQRLVVFAFCGYDFFRFRLYTLKGNVQVLVIIEYSNECLLDGQAFGFIFDEISFDGSR